MDSKETANWPRNWKNWLDLLGLTLPKSIGAVSKIEAFQTVSAAFSKFKPIWDRIGQIRPYSAQKGRYARFCCDLVVTATKLAETGLAVTNWPLREVTVIIQNLAKIISWINVAIYKGNLLA